MRGKIHFFLLQDVAIFIKSNHLEISEVENTIYNMDNSIIEFDILVQIRNIQASLNCTGT